MPPEPLAEGGDFDETLKRLATDYPDIEFRRRHKTPPWQHVVTWIVFTVIAGLLPLIPLAYNEHDAAKVTFTTVFGRGDLILIGTVIAIAGCGEILLVATKVNQNRGFPLAMTIAGSILLSGAGGLWYGEVSANVLRDGVDYKATDLVAYGSTALFVLAAFSSSVCTWFAAGAES